MVDGPMKLPQGHNKQVLDTLSQVQLAIKSTGVYPEDHPATTEILHNSYRALVDHLNAKSVLTLSADGGKLLADDVPLESPNAGFANLALELDQRAIESISFYRGLSRRDYLMFIRAMSQRPQPNRKSGSVDSFLRQNGVTTIRLNGIRYGKVSGKETGGARDHAATAGIAQEKNRGATGSDPDCDRHTRPVHSIDDQANGGTNDREEDTRRPGPEDSLLPPETADRLRGQEPSAGDGKRIAACIDDLLSGGSSDELAALIGDLSRKMDDKSAEIRKGIAESLRAVTAALDEFDCLKDNFQKTSGTLINWMKKENHVI